MCRTGFSPGHFFLYAFFSRRIVQEPATIVIPSAAIAITGERGTGGALSPGAGK